MFCFQDCFSIKSIDLSHNNVPFITKRMFPEDKYDHHDDNSDMSFTIIIIIATRWQPYRLERIDLSHNMMPVLTEGVSRIMIMMIVMVMVMTMLIMIRKMKMVIIMVMLS